MFSQFDQRLAALEEQHKDIVSRLQEEITQLRYCIEKMDENREVYNYLVSVKTKVLDEKQHILTEYCKLTTEERFLRTDLKQMQFDNIVYKYTTDKQRFFCKYQNGHSFVGDFGDGFSKKQGIQFGPFGTRKGYFVEGRLTHGLLVDKYWFYKGYFVNEEIQKGVAISKKYNAIERGNFVGERLQKGICIDDNHYTRIGNFDKDGTLNRGVYLFSDGSYDYVGKCDKNNILQIVKDCFGLVEDIDDNDNDNDDEDEEEDEDDDDTNE